MLSGWEDVKPGAGRASAAPVWAEMGIHLEEDGKGGFHHKLLFPEQSSGLEGPLDRGGGAHPPGQKCIFSSPFSSVSSIWFPSGSLFISSWSLLV